MLAICFPVKFQAHWLCCFNILAPLAGYAANFAFGRIGLFAKFPPQFGHESLKRVVAQVSQKVHSKVQIKASSEFGGKSLSQHSQFGLISSIGVPSFFEVWAICRDSSTELFALSMLFARLIHGIFFAFSARSKCRWYRQIANGASEIDV
jgi:hypothetical protein